MFLKQTNTLKYCSFNKIIFLKNDQFRSERKNVVLTCYKYLKVNSYHVTCIIRAYRRIRNVYTMMSYDYYNNSNSYNEFVEYVGILCMYNSRIMYCRGFTANERQNALSGREVISKCSPDPNRENARNESERVRVYRCTDNIGDLDGGTAGGASAVSQMLLVLAPLLSRMENYNAQVI